MSRHWYVVHTYTGQEFKAREYIKKKLESPEFKDRIFDVLVPEEPVQEMKNGKKRTYRRKLFPGYILVEMDFCEDSYQLLRTIPGVSSFINYDGNTAPKPLTKMELKNLIVKEKDVVEPEPQVQTKLFRIDERVKIIDGAFKDFVGVVEDVNDEKGRLKVRVEIFGRSTPVDVDFLQVERIS